MPWPVSATVVRTGGDHPVRVVPWRTSSLRSRTTLRGPGEIGLVDDEDVGDLEDAGFEDLNGVPGRGRRDHDGRVGRLHDLELGLADADRLEQASVAARGIDETDRLPGRRCEPAEMTTRRHAPDEHAGIERVAHHPDAIAQDRPPGEWARGVHGDDAHQVSLGPPALDHLVAEGALAASRGAGDADHPSAAGSLPHLPEKLGDARIAILDHADRARQGARLAGHQTFGERGCGHRSKSTGAPSSSCPP